MAFLNISGSKDWEVTDAGELLCQNFNKDNAHKKKRQTKNKNKATYNQKISKKTNETVETIASFFKQHSTTSKAFNGNNGLKKKTKKKLGKFPKDATPLDSSFVAGDTFAENGGNTRKTGLKRKQHPTPDKQKLIKKYKKGPNEDEINTHLMTHPKDSKKKSKKCKIKPMNNEKQSVDSSKNNKTTAKLKKISTQFDETKFRKDNNINPKLLEKRKMQIERLHKFVLEKEKERNVIQLPSKKVEPVLTLRQKMMRKLKAARFRFLNEQIYSTTSKDTEKIFRQDPEAFKAYHEGYKLQVKRWPLNPLDKIIKSLGKMNKSYVIADFGCGEARLATSVEQKVHSFDLVAANDRVTACDMAHVPLDNSSVDVAVFCLSLMGTNLKDYLQEANRVLKKGGVLKIAEVESRFEDVNTFVKSCEQYGFKKTWMDLSYNLFYFIDLKKESDIKDKKKLPLLTLQPCLYKKR